MHMQGNTSEYLQFMPEFEQWLVIDKDVSEETLKHHRLQLRKILENAPDFKIGSCRNFLFKMRETVGKGTLQAYIFTIRSFCDFLIQKQIIAHNFGRDIPIPKREKIIPVILSVPELEQIATVSMPKVYCHYANPELAKLTFDTLFMILISCGNRVGETLNMKVGDINWTEGLWTLNHTKTRRGRLVPIPPHALSSMRKLTKGRSADDYVFYQLDAKGNEANTNFQRKSNHTRISKEAVCRNFHGRLRHCGITKKATVHTLRHSFITELLKQDVSILKVANIVGHENIKVTQDYARLLYEDLRDAIMRHPITAKNRNPIDILSQVKTTIEKFHLKDDNRFIFSITEGSGSLRFEVSTK